MAYYRCGPTAALGSRASWGPASTPPELPRPLSGHFDRIFNAFERTTAFEVVCDARDKEERRVAHQDVVCNRKMSSSYERADCALAAQTPSSEDEEFYREKILYSQARQLFPLQEDLADWINKTIGISYLTGDNFLDVLDNGAELCQLAAAIHAQAREALDQGLIVGPVPQIRGRCWQRAARRSFFSRDNAENFITFCREMGVHENLLFESDDLVLHNQPRQVVVCLLELARLAARLGVEPPGLVQLETEIALEERDAAAAAAAAAADTDTATAGGVWQFRDHSPRPGESRSTQQPSPDPNECQLSALDNADAESTKSGGTATSSDSDVPLKPTNELDKRVQLVTRLLAGGCRCGAGAGRCARLLKVKKLGEGRYNIAGRNVFIRLLKGRHMMVRVGGGWDTLEHFLSRHEPCQVRLVAPARADPPHYDPTTTPSKSSSGKTTPTPPKSTSGKTTPTASKPSSGKTSPAPSKASSGKTSPAPSKASSGKTSPAPSKTSSGAASPIDPALARRAKSDARRSSAPKLAQRPLKSTLTLPLNVEPRTAKRNMTLPLDGDPRTRTPTPAPTPSTRARKQSAPSSFGTPDTPGRTARTPPTEYRKSLTSTSLLNAPKKSRSVSLATTPRDEKKSFCGTDRLDQVKKSLNGQTPARKTRSQSLASTPVEPPKPLANGYAKKTRSMSLAISEPLQINGALTQAAIEESIRLSLEASIADDSKKPFLHIKAKYRSPPPREVPPR